MEANNFELTRGVLSIRVKMGMCPLICRSVDDGGAD